MIKARSAGYIVPFTLFLCMFAVSLGYIMYYHFVLSQVYETTMVNNYYARLAALEGITVASGQLSYNSAYIATQDNKEQKAPVKATSDQETQQLFAYLWPRINVWQKIEIPATAPRHSTVYISSEEGKLNINTFYDFNQHAFRSESWKPIIQEFFARLEKKTKTKNLFQGLENFLKNRQEKINDLREFLAIPEFAFFKDALFLDYRKKDTPSIGLYDLFSTDGNKTFVSPLLLSRAYHDLFDIPSLDMQKKSTLASDIAKKIKKLMMWGKDWDIVFGPAYGKKLQNLPKNSDAIFDTLFEPKMFSVISYGTFKSITQGIFAIVERVPLSQKNTVRYTALIRKIIWL